MDPRGPLWRLCGGSQGKVVSCLSTSAPLTQALHAGMSPQNHHVSPNIQGEGGGSHQIHHKSIHSGPWRLLQSSGL